MTNAPKKVFFHKPKDWATWTAEEKAAFVDALLDEMGMPKDETPQSG